MADVGRWLHALFSPDTAYGATAPVAKVAPTTVVSRVGNTYQGQALPAGISSLQAMSADLSKKAAAGKEARQQKKYYRNAAKRGEMAGGWTAEQVMQGDREMGGEANRLMQMLFGDAEANGWGMPKNDREADRLLDRVGYFDPNGGTIDDRNLRAMGEWFRNWPAQKR